MVKFSRDKLFRGAKIEDFYIEMLTDKEHLLQRLKKDDLELDDLKALYFEILRLDKVLEGYAAVFFNKMPDDRDKRKYIESWMIYERKRKAVLSKYKKAGFNCPQNNESDKSFEMESR